MICESKTRFSCYMKYFKATKSPFSAYKKMNNIFLTMAGQGGAVLQKKKGFFFFFLIHSGYKPASLVCEGPELKWRNAHVVCTSTLSSQLSRSQSRTISGTVNSTVLKYQRYHSVTEKDTSKLNLSFQSIKPPLPPTDGSVCTEPRSVQNKTVTLKHVFDRVTNPRSTGVCTVSYCAFRTEFFRAVEKM